MGSGCITGGSDDGGGAGMPNDTESLVPTPLESVPLRNAKIVLGADGKTEHVWAPLQVGGNNLSLRGPGGDQLYFDPVT